jgi:hypothetical protein
MGWTPPFKSVSTYHSYCIKSVLETASSLNNQKIIIMLLSGCFVTKSFFLAKFYVHFVKLLVIVRFFVIMHSVLFE